MRLLLVIQKPNFGLVRQDWEYIIFISDWTPFRNTIHTATSATINLTDFIIRNLFLYPPAMI